MPRGGGAETKAPEKVATRVQVFYGQRPSRWDKVVIPYSNQLVGSTEWDSGKRLFKQLFQIARLAIIHEQDVSVLKFRFCR